ncbi:MAG: ATP-binding protein [Bacillota bacterium]|nr:ATP-binding protein [Bacillota bacterium]
MWTRERSFWALFLAVEALAVLALYKAGFHFRVPSPWEAYAALLILAMLGEWIRLEAAPRIYFDLTYWLDLAVLILFGLPAALVGHLWHLLASRLARRGRVIPFLYSMGVNVVALTASGLVYERGLPVWQRLLAPVAGSPSLAAVWLGAASAAAVNFALGFGLLVWCQVVAAGGDWRFFAQVGLKRILPSFLALSLAGVVLVAVYRLAGVWPMAALAAALLGIAGLLTGSCLHSVEGRENRELKQILDSVPTGIVSLTERGRVTFFNRAAEELTGISARAMVGLSFAETPLSVRFPLLEADRRPGGSREIRFAHLSDAGRDLCYQWHPYHDPGGNLLGYVLVFWDATVERQLEETKEYANRLAAFNQVAATLSHEMKNPLAIIRGYGELLLERCRSQEGEEPFRQEVKEAAQIVVSEADRLTKILQEMILGAAHREYTREPIDVIELLEEVALVFRAEFARTGISWNLDLGSRGFRLRPLVLAAREPLQRVFFNILLNAVEAMPEGGSLTVTGSYDVEEGLIHLYFSDSGVGIPPEVLPRVLEPFYTTKQGGTGLGLTICNQIIEGLGGTLRITSIQGQGTTVRLSLPAYEGEEGEKTANKAAEVR